jgi:molybdate transport system substrate-binding protein
MFSTTPVSNMSVRLSSFCSILLLVSAQVCLAQTTLTVAAAADLTLLEPVLQQQFEKTNPIRLRFVTGASAALAQQIENGAPYDVFLSANAQFVDRLASNRKIDPASVQAYAVGQVGLLWKDGKQHNIKDLAAHWVRIVALPNPQLAPYGVAAQQALEHLGIWPSVQPKVVYGENVRQTLELFESGNADAVLTSDSLLQGRPVTIIPNSWHAPILQKVGILANSSQPKAAQTFTDFLLTPAAQSIFNKFGFMPPPPVQLRQ